MWLTHRGKNCVLIDDRVFARLLSYYPEEELIRRPILEAALVKGQITKSDLLREADILFIPWQMFLLSWDNLRAQIKNIENNRKDKIRAVALSSRPGASGPLPNRLVDRYIRAQTFLSAAVAGTRPPNKCNGCLRGKSVSGAVAELQTCLNLDMEEFWRKGTKARALEYLIACVEEAGINVARGTADARLMPRSANHTALYKNVSGFCLKDDRVPFVFVNSSMAEDEEPLGRQIYTLAYLLALIGLGQYMLIRNWKPSSSYAGRHAAYLKRAHDIASELLMPAAALTRYRGNPITEEIILDLGARHKLTPTAILYRLKRDGYITAEEEDALTGPKLLRKSRGRTPHIENAVNKLNGRLVVSAVHAGFPTGQITQNQAQYILFGRVRRKLWREYRARVGI